MVPDVTGSAVIALLSDTIEDVSYIVKAHKLLLLVLVFKPLLDG